RRCLQHAVVGERAAITIFVAPSDLERVRGELADALPPGASLAADPDLAPASVRVETDAGTVAYDPGEVLRRLCDELRKELAACRWTPGTRRRPPGRPPGTGRPAPAVWSRPRGWPWAGAGCARHWAPPAPAARR